MRFLHCGDAVRDGGQNSRSLQNLHSVPESSVPARRNSQGVLFRAFPDIPRCAPQRCRCGSTRRNRLSAMPASK